MKCIWYFTFYYLIISSHIWGANYFKTNLLLALFNQNLINELLSGNCVAKNK